MLKVRFLILLFALFLTPFIHAHDYMGKYLFQFLETFANKMEKELDLECNGKSGGLKGKIERIDITFSARRRATIEEGKGLASLRDG